MSNKSEVWGKSQILDAFDKVSTSEAIEKMHELLSQITGLNKAYLKDLYEGDSEKFDKFCWIVEEAKCIIDEQKILATPDKRKIRRMDIDTL